MKRLMEECNLLRRYFESILSRSLRNLSEWRRALSVDFLNTLKRARLTPKGSSRCQAASYRGRDRELLPILIHVWTIVYYSIALGVCGGEGMALQIFISHTGGRLYADPNALPSYVPDALYWMLADFHVKS